MKRRKNSLRLQNFDYTQPGNYFITICTYDRLHLFGKVVKGEMILNLFGRIAEYHWQRIPNHFKNAQLLDFCVMPHHIHGIICLTNKYDNGTSVVVGVKHCKQKFSSFNNNIASNASPLHDQPQQFHKLRQNGTIPGSIPAIIQNFCSITTRKINRIRKTPGSKVWQRGYYDHINRNDIELLNIRNYIINNPLNWKD
jgi:REP element-mobilizing transposase RayT